MDVYVQRGATHWPGLVSPRRSGSCSDLSRTPTTHFSPRGSFYKTTVSVVVNKTTHVNSMRLVVKRLCGSAPPAVVGDHLITSSDQRFRGTCRTLVRC